jgi:hypothetical protein
VTSYSQLGSFRLTGLPEPPVEPLDWGSHRFTVFYPATPMNVEDVSVRVARIVEREKPAHAEALYCPVLPRFRVGLQSTIGVDAVVGDINPVVLNRLATLSYDTVLGCSPLERQMRESGGALRPRAGVTTKLP